MRIIRRYWQSEEFSNSNKNKTEKQNCVMDNIRAQFYFFIGNFVEFSYKEIKPSGQERTAAEWDYVAEATRRRRRILQSRILS